MPKYFREDIQDITWATSHEDFLQDPVKQETFMDWYIDSTLLPGLEKVGKQVDTSVYTYPEVLALIHFLWANGTIEYISTSKMNEKQQVGNIDAQRYLDIVNAAMEAYN